MILEEMLGSWRRGQRGPLPQLTTLQLLNALIVIERRGPIGRRALAQALRINDGTARGLLERLGERGIVRVDETGVTLSQKGKTSVYGLLKQMSIMKIQPLQESDLASGKYATGVHFKEKYDQGMTGIAQRDEAIKSGAQGSITIAVWGGRLVIPPDNRDLRDISIKDDARLRDIFELEDNDLVVIGFADSPDRALSGALAAALTLATPSKT